PIQPRERVKRYSAAASGGPPLPAILDKRYLFAQPRPLVNLAPGESGKPVLAELADVESIAFQSCLFLCPLLRFSALQLFQQLCATGDTAKACSLLWLSIFV